MKTFNARRLVLLLALLLAMPAEDLRLRK